MAYQPHTFLDPELESLALTHASISSAENNERLEFLGDTVLDLLVAEELYRSVEKFNEGVMTERKAWLVSREVLAQAARDLDLESRALLGEGIQDRKLPRSVLANLYEAYLGAIYLDAGLPAARKFVLHTLGEHLLRVEQVNAARNPKQELQERCQASSGRPPRYVLVEERGTAHARAFLVQAKVGEQRFPSAWGRTRKEAERWAAHEALLVQDHEAEAAAE